VILIILHILKDLFLLRVLVGSSICITVFHYIIEIIFDRGKIPRPDIFSDKSGCDVCLAAVEAAAPAAASSQFRWQAYCMMSTQSRKASRPYRCSCCPLLRYVTDEGLLPIPYGPSPSHDDGLYSFQYVIFQ